MTDVLYVSSPMTIDRHEWRAVVYVDEWYGPCLKYQFRGIGELPLWQDHTRWPSYDCNNGSTGGLPTSLRVLFNRHVAEIDRALGKTPSPETFEFASL